MQRPLPPIVLQRGRKEKRLRFFPQRTVLAVFDDADDFEVWAEVAVPKREPHPPTQRALVRPEKSRHCFIDDDDWWRSFDVPTIELSPGYDRNAHRFKVTRPHYIVIYLRIIAVRPLMAFDGHPGMGAAERQRDDFGQSGCLHARRSFDLIDQLLVEDSAARFVIPGRLQIQLNSQHTLGLKARIDVLRLSQAAQEQPRADQQDQ